MSVQLSAARNSNVGYRFDGRTSQYNVDASSMIPPAIRSAATHWYAATLGGSGGTPDIGHMDHHMVRKRANPVSTPSCDGELDVRAASAGTYGRSGS